MNRAGFPKGQNSQRMTPMESKKKRIPTYMAEFRERGDLRLAVDIDPQSFL